ncbi:MAG: hypothetical protein KDI98_06470, partial [Hyphomicrobiaceae bacterium]|nr:hypothetical protein [Hyphomicrobiaceae bacterium]
GVAARYLSAIRVEPSDSEAAAWLQAERERFIAAGESIAGTDADMRAFLQAARDGTAATETTPAVQVMITDEIDPQSSVSFTLRVDQPTEILLIGDGGSDLDIEIVGPNGSVLCRSSGYSDREYCRIAPRGLETLSMRVTNRGRLSNRFLVLGA